MKKYCYFNGKIIDTKKAKIDLYDLGVLRSYAVFDVACAHNGKPFLLEGHWKRFVNSAKELDINLPLNKKSFDKIMRELLKKNNLDKTRANVRTILTGGMSPDSFTYVPGNETLYILVEKAKPIAKEIIEKGACVVLVEHSRFFPKAKITNYIVPIKNQKSKIKNKCLEIVYVKDNNVLEA